MEETDKKKNSKGHIPGRSHVAAGESYDFNWVTTSFCYILVHIF